MSTGYIKYDFLDGRKVKDLSAKQLKDESEAFTRWSLQQDKLPNAKKHAFKAAFTTVIALRGGGFTCTQEEEDAAVALLEGGLYFSENQQTHERINKHHGHNKGRG